MGEYIIIPKNYRFNFLVTAVEKTNIKLKVIGKKLAVRPQMSDFND